jgi:micrococcal nuclease
MRAFFVVATGVAIVGLIVMARSGSKPPDDLYGPCRVTYIVDGDTVDVNCSGERARLRLLNIDTPERGRAGYWEASHSLAELVNNQHVQLAFETPNRATLDRFGRVLAYLYDEEGRNLNQEMIRLGWTRFYVKYGEGRFARDFEATEFEAMRSGQGLWASRALADY